MAELSIIDVPDAKRYEGRLGDETAGFVEYILAGRTIVLAHTEIDPAFEGQGVGGQLARAVLDDIRERGELEVVPTCPFISAWIAKHPDYVDVVTPSMRSQFS